MVGAGVLPVAMRNGCVYLLFGRENELGDTPGWSDFGGGAERGETALDAAAREGSEELNGMLGSQHRMKILASKRAVATLKYATYTTFAFKTHYDPRLEDYYRNNYKFFEKYLPAVKKDSGNGLLEKSEIKWFTFPELRKNKSNFREFYRNMVDVILDNESVITAKLKKMKTKCRRTTTRTRRTRRTRRSRK
jgi:hypothetical protein